MDIDVEPFMVTFCKLCRNVMSVGDFKAIKEIINEVLDILLLKLSAQEKKILVICKVCRTKLFAAFNFKAVCTDTEDCIFPYVHSEIGVPVDLREVYLKERGKEHLKYVLEDERICRLCMKVVTCGFTSVEEVDVGTLQRYIPEVNFYFTTEPVICKVCLNALNLHANFLNNFLYVTEEINDICDSDTKESLISIKCEDVEIKSEDNYSDMSFRKLKDQPGNDTSVCESKNGKTINNSMLKCKTNEHGSEEKYHGLKYKVSSESQIYKCDSRDCETEEIKNLAGHQRTHRDVTEEHMYNCDLCSYQTKRMDYFTQHQLRHKNKLEKQMYKCDLCDFKTVYRYNLTNHQKRHKDDISETEAYKCDSCDYKSIYKNNLSQHLLKHKKLRYKCDSCDFKTIYKHYLTRHQQIHKDISEKQVHKCDLCDYNCVEKYQLTRHQLKHKNHRYKCDSCDYKSFFKDNLTLHQLKHTEHRYKCNSCDFVTIYKNYLARHQQIHKDISEKQVFKCDACDYTCGEKRHLIRHQLKHKNHGYKCDSCDFKTVYKYNLAQHKERHKDISEKEVYKCDSCDYKSFFKNNLNRHQLKHTEHRYKCDSCDFKTIYKYNLTQHQEGHKDISEKAGVQM